MAQKKTYKVIDEDTVRVTIKEEGLPTQVGTMVRVGKTFKPDGIWRQYDKNNQITLTVMFIEGRKLWVEKDWGNSQVVINYRQGTF